MHLAPRKDRRSYGRQRKSRKQLSESDGVESLQRTSLPLLRTALHHPKQTGRSIELFTEATELNPNFAEAYHERGRAKLLNGDKEGSAEDMKKGLELNPKEIQNFNGQYGNQPGGSTGNILGL